MWLLTTRGRQADAQRLLDACADTGMTQPGLCHVDGGTYPGLRLPDNWALLESPENIGVGPAMRGFFETRPHLPFYGWLADDFVPQTPGWDVALSRAAGRRHIAYCHDGWPDRDGRAANPRYITSAFALGGDLVRATGWFAPPGLRQAGIDSAWNALGRRFGLMRYLPDIRVEHLHWKNGKRAKDAVDNDPSDETRLWRQYIIRQQHHDVAAVRDFLAA